MAAKKMSSWRHSTPLGMPVVPPVYTQYRSSPDRGPKSRCGEAPANAVSWGFWEVATRPDGSKQWAYKGSPLYTYAGDRKPGDIEGNNRHVVVYGDPEGKIDMTAAVGSSPRGGGPSMESGAGFYWHIAGLFF